MALALRLAQEGKDDALVPLLTALGFTHRLSPHILSYASEYHAMRTASAELAADGLVCALEHVLSQPFLGHMQLALGPEALFWRDTGYSSAAGAGYFSFVHPLGDGTRCATAMDQLIASVLELLLPSFPKLARARYAEWWAHNRAHEAGHQLHFDSDNEGQGGVRNPIVSTVLFLSAAGGPTLITEQTLSSRALSPHAWLAYPRENRLLAFDGALLHSVVPGRSAFATERRRITVMIAFWDAIRIRDPPMNGRSTLGPARSFPDPRDAASPQWCRAFAPCRSAGTAVLDTETRPAPVVAVRPAWQAVSPGAKVPRDSKPPYDALYQGL